MGYMHIDNLYKNQEILMFKECYAMEKIHGTSAHITFEKGKVFEDLHCTGNNKQDDKITFYSGGEKYENFITIFDKENLLKVFGELGFEKATIYGEAYGGKQQGMRDTYGSVSKFVVFDVKIGDRWVNVPKAEEFTLALGLEFVAYEKVSTRLASLDVQRDRDSIQAIRNGLGVGKMREGVVLKPLVELTKNNGGRIICKHKRDEFRETKKKRKIIDPMDLEVLKKAEEVADEWVTLMRLSHVLDKIEDPCMQKMREIIIAMVEDIKREGDKEIDWSRQVVVAIGKATAKITKQYFNNKLKEGNK